MMQGGFFFPRQRLLRCDSWRWANYPSGENVLENGDELCRYLDGFKNDGRKIEGLHARMYSKAWLNEEGVIERRPRFSHCPCANEVAFPSLVQNRGLRKYSCLGPLQVNTKISVHSEPLISHRDQEVGQSILLVLTSSNNFKIINSWREDFPRSYASKNRLFLARKPKRPMRPVENIYGACRWN